MKDRLWHLATGGLVMMPQHFYGEAFKIGMIDGDEAIVSYPSGEEVLQESTLGMLMDREVLVTLISEDEFNDATVDAYMEYFYHDDIEYEGPQRTHLVCRECFEADSITKQDSGSKPYYCMSCDAMKDESEVFGSGDEWVLFNSIESDSDNFWAFLKGRSSDEIVEFTATILTDGTGDATVEYALTKDYVPLLSGEVNIGEWEDKLEVTHAIDGEYLNVWFGDEKMTGIQLKRDEEGFVLDLVDSSYGPEEFVRELGWVMYNELQEEDDDS